VFANFKAPAAVSFPGISTGKRMHKLLGERFALYMSCIYFISGVQKVFVNHGRVYFI